MFRQILEKLNFPPIDEKKNQEIKLKETDDSNPKPITPTAKDDYYIPSLEIKVGLSPNPNSQHFALVQATIGTTRIKAVAEAPTVVFVLDKSKSMWHERQRYMKEGLKEAIRTELPSNAKVQIILFDRGARVLCSGVLSSLPNINKLIDGISMGAGTNFEAGFGLVDPDFFGEGANLIAFLTDGENNEGTIKDAYQIKKILQEKFESRGKKLPNILSIAVGKGSDVKETSKFDHPVKRAFYAEDAKAIVSQFTEVAEAFGKEFLPVKIAYHTAIQTRNKELGDIQIGQKLLGAFHIRIAELELKSPIKIVLTIDKKNIEYEWTVPNLKNLSHHPSMIEIYYTNHLNHLSDERLRTAKSKILNCKKDLAWLQSIDPNFLINYKNVSDFINLLYNAYIMQKNIGNTGTNSAAQYAYSISSGTAALQIVSDLEQKREESIDKEYKPEYKGLSFDIFTDDMVSLVKNHTQLRWVIKLSVTDTSYIDFDPSDELLLKYSRSVAVNQSNLKNVIKYVNQLFLREVDLQHEESLTSYLARGEGNTLLKALVCAYFVAVNIDNNNLTEGVVKIHHGVEDRLQQLHFWCIYQTEANIYLMDPTNKDEFTLVNLQNEEDRRQLIYYYEDHRGLGGVLRDTLNMLHLSYHERELVTLPHPRLQQARATIDPPEELCCPISGELMVAPVYAEKINLIFDDKSAKPTSLEKELTSITTDTTTLIAVKQYTARLIAELWNGFQLTKAPDPSAKETLASSTETSERSEADEKKLPVGSKKAPDTAINLSLEQKKESFGVYVPTQVSITNTKTLIRSTSRFFLEEKIKSTSFFVCRSQGLFLEMIFTDPKVKESKKISEKFISTKDGYKRSLFIEMIMRISYFKIDFSSVENSTSFIELFGVQGQLSHDKNKMEFKLGDEVGFYYYTKYPKILYFEGHHPVFGVPKFGVQAKKHYLEVANGTTTIITRNEYLDKIRIQEEPEVVVSRTLSA